MKMNHDLGNKYADGQSDVTIMFLFIECAVNKQMDTRTTFVTHSSTRKELVLKLKS
jgi:hypothetical protein